MRTHVLLCGPYDGPLPTDPQIHALPNLPGRRDLQLLNEITSVHLPHDPTPTLEEITRQPDVAHLSEPKLAPQREHLTEPLRFIVVGSDAALSAILTRLMRIDALWVEIAFIPQVSSTTATSWNIAGDPWKLALEGSIAPTPLIRDDAGIAIAGSASITTWDGTELYGEIIVDSETLCAGFEEGLRRKIGTYGTKLVPMLKAPGIAAVPYTTSLEPRTGFLGLRDRSPRGSVDSSRLATGRALQAGGKQLKVTVDGITRPRPVKHVTFYRHLRDLQAVRIKHAG
ncbi:hypothetical protein [Corynebacterium freiburgense]|uniref:hypothetical protein n=1 Tax=Corynebacterium freiburgense TaxID=556548 RepID=UPI00041D076D|nr:hypothetical protein [Corynebacterium freiburgense]WJZ03758.1 hypothetical protein CFREI_12505 [Corynebacterium freiburgense]